MPAPDNVPPVSGSPPFEAVKPVDFPSGTQPHFDIAIAEVLALGKLGDLKIGSLRAAVLAALGEPVDAFTLSPDPGPFDPTPRSVPPWEICPVWNYGDLGFTFEDDAVKTWHLCALGSGLPHFVHIVDMGFGYGTRMEQVLALMKRHRIEVRVETNHHQSVFHRAGKVELSTIFAPGATVIVEEGFVYEISRGIWEA